jgi:hypothetical protein
VQTNVVLDSWQDDDDDDEQQQQQHSNNTARVVQIEYLHCLWAKSTTTTPE